MLDSIDAHTSIFKLFTVMLYVPYLSLL